MFLKLMFFDRMLCCHVANETESSVPIASTPPPPPLPLFPIVYIPDGNKVFTYSNAVSRMLQEGESSVFMGGKLGSTDLSWAITFSQITVDWYRLSKYVTFT